MNNNEHLVKELNKQLGFIRWSCKGYINGGLNEAFRIAIVVRTLLYDGEGLISLLTHMGLNCINLVSSVSSVPRAPGAAQVFVDKIGPTPQIPRSKSLLPVSIEDWWSEVLYESNGQAFNRGTAVLWGANLANWSVNAQVSPNQEEFFRSGWIVSNYQNNELLNSFESPAPILVALCRMGYELLLSEDLVRAAGIDTPAPSN